MRPDSDRIRALLRMESAIASWIENDIAVSQCRNETTEEINASNVALWKFLDLRVDIGCEILISYASGIGNLNLYLSWVENRLDERVNLLAVGRLSSHTPATFP